MPVKQMPSLKSRIVRYILKRKIAQVDPNESREAKRARYEAMAAKFPLPKGVTVEAAHVGGRYAEWLRPVDSANDRAILYLHGGAYTVGSCNTHRALAMRIGVASATPVLLLDYRLAPEHPFPAALDDTLAAFGELISVQGIAPGRIAVIGDSAGGGLALSLTVRLRDEGTPLPAAVVCLSPWTDLELANESVINRAKHDIFFPTTEGLRNSAALYAGKMPLRYPYISPIHASMHGLPPLMIQVGDDEILLDDSRVLVQRARAAGVDVSLSVWKGMWHVWHVFAPTCREANEAIRDIGTFVRQRLSQP